MATSSILLSEEQVQCSICLDVFTQPVSTPCGHNYCLACITDYWDSGAGVYQCPMCKERFTVRPELGVNTFISEMSSQVKKLPPVEVTSLSADRKGATSADVVCDDCTGAQSKAIKSCLVCLSSFCETHLEPHQRVASLKKHKLIPPVENLEGLVCKKHDRPLELFCREDKTCICQFCSEGDHRNHTFVTIEEEVEKQLSQMKVFLQKSIEERQQKIKDLRDSVKLRKKNTEEDIAEHTKAFTAVVHDINRCQTELIQLMEENQKVMEKQTGSFIEELEQEVTDLKKKRMELDQFSPNKDQVKFLQKSPSVFIPPSTKEWSKLNVCVDSGVWRARETITQLEKTLQNCSKVLLNAELKSCQQFEVDVTLNQNTAYPDLIVSGERKQVSRMNRKYYFSDNPGRFDYHPCVLGNEGFSAGKFYYEVQVKDKTGWVLGVAVTPIKRKGPIIRSPENGHWAIGLWNAVHYEAYAGPEIPLYLRGKPQKVGVFVDYEEGEVSFYDVEARSLIYSFTGCKWSEELYPCFSAGIYDDGKNSAPLVICRVSR